MHVQVSEEDLLGSIGRLENPLAAVLHAGFSLRPRARFGLATSDFRDLAGDLGYSEPPGVSSRDCTNEDQRFRQQHNPRHEPEGTVKRIRSSGAASFSQNR